MTVKEIRSKASALSVAGYSRLNKENLIRAVQLAEGNQDCFRRIADCGQSECCWRDDCLAQV